LLKRNANNAGSVCVCAHWGSASIYLLCKVENICRYPWQWEIYCSTRQWLKNISCREL